MRDEFEGVINDEFKEAKIGFILEALQNRYFAEIEPRATLAFEQPETGSPACLHLPKGEIWIDPAIAHRSFKISGVLLLHELIHHKLFIRDGYMADEEGPNFQVEVARLFKEGAYAKFL